MRSMLLWVSENEWCRETLPNYGFVKKAVRRFMPGETLEDALGEAKRLETEYRIPSLVTFLGENVADRDEARAVADHYVDAVRAVGEQGLDAEISLKPTHLGLDLGDDVAFENIVRVTKAAAERDSWVWVDMEYSRYVDPTLDLYKAIRAEHPNFGICLQAYLHRTAQDVEDLLPLGPGVRLVKGAYAEPPDVAMPDKKDVDRAFYELSVRMLQPDARQAGLRLGVATHDGALIRELGQWADSEGLPKDAYEVQMLYGIATDLQRSLAKEGRGIRVLISYGKHWFPWYVRRLAERPANVGFVLKSMLPG